MWAFIRLPRGVATIVSSWFLHNLQAVETEMSTSSRDTKSNLSHWLGVSGARVPKKARFESTCDCAHVNIGMSPGFDRHGLFVNAICRLELHF